MSESTTPMPVQNAPAPVSATNSLLNPTFLMAIGSMAIVAGTVASVLWTGDDGNIKLVLGFVLGSMGGGVVSFYFGSSKSSQAKDEASTVPLVGTTTTTVTPITTTTTTEPTP